MPFSYQGGHILLYHAVFSKIPSGLESRLHNVFPDEFKRQIKWLSSAFEIVSMDEFTASKDTRGLATITFDDAYADLFTGAIPWLVEQGIPCTVFMNSNLVCGDIFWRDKVRFVLAEQLEEDFLAFFAQEEWTKKIRPERFYKDSKQHGLNSHLVDQALNVFFAERQLNQQLETLTKVIAKPSDLIDDPLIHYGNHSASHYVLSSLKPDQQCEEIISCQKWLNKGKYRCTSSFALPFGGTQDADENTFAFINDAECSAILMSRQAVNRNQQKDPVTELPIFERYMAPATLDELIALSRQLDQMQ